MVNLLSLFLLLIPLSAVAQSGYRSPDSRTDFSQSDQATICHWYARSDVPAMQQGARDAAARRNIRCLTEEDRRAEAERRDRAEAERRRIAARFSDPALRSLPWKDRLDRVVQEELRRWLTVTPQGTDEVAPPAFPAALSLRQEPWETNREFEDRVEKARSERKQVIDRLQADYRARVEERNRRVAEYNRLRQERESKLGERRRELVQEGLRVLSPAVALSDVAFDQQTGSVTVVAQVEGQGRQTFAFLNTPQSFRRSALTEPQNLRATPQFVVSDSGDVSLQAILVEAGGASARGLPSAGGAASIQLAAVTLPTAAAPAVAAQSAVTVDRNQVESILYREENEMLRKRLEEQRRQQEQALAVAEARAGAEAARLRAEAEALKKQLASGASGPSSVPTMKLEAHALVIGNAAYAGSGRLPNPENDARAMAAKLRSLGFTVTQVTNTSRDQMVKALADFSRSAARADLTLLFYAGHGVQIAGVNYMIPVDMNLNDPTQATLQSVSLNSVVEQYLPGKSRLVFLDACRDNPLMASSGRSVSRGLAPINATQGTLIAYATKDGQTAEDGNGSNSPFTVALLEHLDEPQDIAVVLRKVRENVVARTNGRQQPWEYGSLTGGALVLSSIRSSR